jgi:hypothetical protein
MDRKDFKLLPTKYRRRIFRELGVAKGYYTKFSKKNVRITLKDRIDYLNNFICNFSLILKSKYDVSNFYTKLFLNLVLTSKRRKSIIDKTSLVTMKEIIKLYKFFYNKKEFISYFRCKTNLSFAIKNIDWYWQIDNYCKIVEKESEAVSQKFSEFLHVILNEYLLIHNLMWASGYKLKSVDSIDEFLVDID